MQKRELIVMKTKIGVEASGKLQLREGSSELCKMKKIERLRSLIASGDYRIPSAHIAEGLMRAMRG